MPMSCGKSRAAVGPERSPMSGCSAEPGRTDDTGGVGVCVVVVAIARSLIAAPNTESSAALGDSCARTAVVAPEAPTATISERSEMTRAAARRLRSEAATAERTVGIGLMMFSLRDCTDGACSDAAKGRPGSLVGD